MKPFRDFAFKDDFNYDFEKYFDEAHSFCNQNLIEYLVELFQSKLSSTIVLGFSKNIKIIKNFLSDIEDKDIEAALKNCQSPKILLKFKKNEEIWKKLFESNISKHYTVDDLEIMLKDSPSDLKITIKNSNVLIAYYKIHRNFIDADELFNSCYNQVNKVSAFLIPYTTNLNVIDIIHDSIAHKNTKILESLLESEKYGSKAREILETRNEDFVHEILRNDVEKGDEKINYFYFF